MAKVLNFYIDDSGTRYPNKNRGTKAEHGYDWFALGGILIEDSAEECARALYKSFVSEWSIGIPLHSAEIRSQKEGFKWLRGLDDALQIRFHEELYELLRSVPAIGLAAVIDRDGYNARYSERYSGQPWLLCKTAFGIVVERAAKHARAIGLKLRICPERCNKKEDGLVLGYYEGLRTEGIPFPGGGDERYSPLTALEFRETLHELKPKFKSSPMAQLADLYLWPMCMGGYHRSNRTYKRLLDDRKLIECWLPAELVPTRGTKYSCFENVKMRP
jgi:hypothetical protein